MVFLLVLAKTAEIKKNASRVMCKEAFFDYIPIFGSNISVSPLLRLGSKILG